MHKKDLGAERIGQRYAAGETVRAIADSHDVSRWVIDRHLREAGVAVRPKIKYRFDPADIAARYAAGESASAIARALRVTEDVIFRCLRDAGAAKRSKAEAIRLEQKQRPHGSKPKYDIDPAELASDYAGGKSIRKIARGRGTAASTIRYRLGRDRIPRRASAEAVRLRFDQMDRWERVKWAKMATANFPDATSIAAWREENVFSASPLEKELAGILSGLGLTVCPQKAVGSYSLDVALPDIGVGIEVHSLWHLTRDAGGLFRTRADYLLGEGWLPVYLWTDARNCLSYGALAYMLKIIERKRAGAPLRHVEYVLRTDAVIPDPAYYDAESGWVIRGLPRRCGSWVSCPADPLPPR